MRCGAFKAKRRFGRPARSATAAEVQKRARWAGGHPSKEEFLDDGKARHPWSLGLRSDAGKSGEILAERASRSHVWNSMREI